MGHFIEDCVAERISICKSCPELNRLNMCKQCGCFMPAKVRLKQSVCPLGKWGSYIVHNDTKVDPPMPPETTE